MNYNDLFLEIEQMINAMSDEEFKEHLESSGFIVVDDAPKKPVMEYSFEFDVFECMVILLRDDYDPIWTVDQTIKDAS